MNSTIIIVNALYLALLFVLMIYYHNKLEEATELLKQGSALMYIAKKRDEKLCQEIEVLKAENKRLKNIIEDSKI